MSQNTEQETVGKERTTVEPESPNLKIHGEPPPGSPLPGTENPDSETVNNEVNPNTE